MAAIDQLINIVITQSTTAVTTTSTTIPLIVGDTQPGWADTDFVHTYYDADTMLTDGFAATSPEYVAATALLSQTIVPGEFLVGRRIPSDIVDTTTLLLTLNFGTGQYYGLTLQGQSIQVSGSYAAIVASNLAAAINTAALAGLSAAVDSVGDNVVLTLVGGSSITTASPIGLTVSTPTTTASSAPTLASCIAQITAQNDTWYGLVATGASDADILSAAGYVEAHRKIFIAASATAAVGTATSTTDIGAELQAAEYARTALMFSPGSASIGIDAAWVGGFLPDTPGAYNTAYMTLAGIEADILTASQQTACIGNPVTGTQGKNVNIYTAVQDIGITQMGTMASGQYIDLTVGIDALYFALQTAMFSDLVNNKKIPYTDRGVAILVAGVRGVLEAQIASGLIDGTQAYSVSAPKVSTVAKTQRASRIAPTISFTCVVQGAVNSIRVSGTISV